MRALQTLDRPAIEELRQRDEFFWLDLCEPGDEDVAALGELFGFHPLTLEDTSTFGQRPKLEDYGQYAFVVFYGAGGEARHFEPIEVHLFVSGSYAITIRRADIPELDALREGLGSDPREGEQFLLYRIFDRLTDSFFPLLESMDDEIDRLEDAVVASPTDEQLQRIFGLKKQLVGLRRVITPQRDLFARATDEIAMLPGLEPASHDYFRDVYDHLIRISDLVDSYRDLLTGAMDVYLSTVSNRLNQVMKQLTIIATIFLPLTFVTGFFGQNFGWLVDNVDTFTAFALLGLGGVVLPVAAMLVWFRRSGYL
jgi:magnesium transporter